MILTTAQGRYRVKVKHHGVIVADRTFLRRTDAARWEAEQKQRLLTRRSATAAAGSMRLDRLFDAWSLVRPAQVEARTWHADQSAWASHLRSSFGAVPVADITSNDVQMFAASLRKHRTRATVTRVVATLAALLEFAATHRYIDTNPARIRLSLRHDPPRHSVTLNPDVLVQVWQRQLAYSPLADVTIFLGLTGLRWGEFVALRAGDVVLTPSSGWMLAITRTIVRERGEGPALIKSTKSNRDRLVPLTNAALAVARHWSEGQSVDQLLVPGKDGDPLRPSTFRRAVHWTETVPPDLRIHDLRHSAATNLLQAGADIIGVQGILGHSTSATTLRFYAHAAGVEYLRGAMNHYEASVDAAIVTHGGELGATNSDLESTMAT